MGEINVFNTFSFKKWSDRLKEQKIEEEVQKQRMEQVARLRDKLIKERELRDQSDALTDEDIEKLIAYLNAGNSINGQTLQVPPRPTVPKIYYEGGAARSLSDRMQFTTKDDDYIFNELKRYYAKHRTLTGAVPAKFEHNRRFGEYRVPTPHDVAEAKGRFFSFSYNRRFKDSV
ncbi:Protein F48E8.8 [Aphelenchoides avenae]|nr:Protein F48E8.8 [Aphelenchus avenae]KAH7724545.1 Protein F48E8.8 [Aphelenchus avenae]